MSKYLLFDIGGTNIKMATYDGCLSDVKEYPTEAKLGANKLVEKIISLVSLESNYDAIGISTAGQVNAKEGYIIYANENMPGYTGTKWKEILESKFNVPVYVENDVNAAALGEGYAGVAKGKDDYLCLTFGTGVGGAIVIGGKVYHGSSGSAGEFGAMLLDIGKHQKGDAFSGGYEKIGSTTTLVKKAMEYKEELNNGRLIFSNLDDSKVLDIVKSWTYDVSLGLTSLIHIFNPAMVILGGGIMEQELVFNEVLKNVQDELMPSFKNVEIKRAELGNKAGLFGALSLIQKELN